MAKQSAGLLVYRRTNKKVEVLLGHPGGPFWAKRDKGVWSIPKGEFDVNEQPLTAAKREFQEELGIVAPKGEPFEIGSVKLKSGKTIYAWAVEADLSLEAFSSNMFEIEWPAKSGKLENFPELDRVAYLSLDKAATKIHPGQAEFLTRLADLLHVETPQAPEQVSLF